MRAPHKVDALVPEGKCDADDRASRYQDDASTHLSSENARAGGRGRYSPFDAAKNSRRQRSRAAPYGRV